MAIPKKFNVKRFISDVDKNAKDDNDNFNQEGDFKNNNDDHHHQTTAIVIMVEFFFLFFQCPN